MNQNKRMNLWIGILAVVIAVALLVTLLLLYPWPIRLSMELHAVYTDADGNVAQEMGTFQFDCRVSESESNRLVIEMELPEALGLRYHASSNDELILDYPHSGLDEDDIILMVSLFSDTQKSYDSAWIIFNKQEGLFVMSNPFEDGYYLTGSVSGDVSAAEILERFAFITTRP